MRRKKTQNNRKPGQVPLERALSKRGLASRTVARGWIIAGKVKVNGTVRKDPGYLVVPERAQLEIEGQLASRVPFRVFVLNKPRGVVTTRSDEKGRATVFSLIKEDLPHLSAVGRLDLATSGLLILTNSTRLAAWLTDPAQQIKRIYVVTVRGEVTGESQERLRAGISDEGEVLRVDDVVLQKASGRESHLVVTLCEGKNREIRRMFGALGHEVTRLKRVAYGGLTLGALQPGEYRELSRQDLQSAFPGMPHHIIP